MAKTALAATMLPIIVLALGGAPRAEPARASPASPASPSPGLAAAADPCRRMVGNLPDLTDAPTRVTAATVVAAAAGLPAFCHVTATIRPDIGLQMRLPVLGWNGKFMQYARGGYCRPVAMADCDTPLRKGYACAITDQGNKTTRQDDDWAYDDVQAKVDCGFRAVHVATVAGKALTERFYGAAPAFSYLIGCSTGGRMAMVEATRFPYDFDGIVAGAPPISKYLNSLSLAWDVVSTLDKAGKPILFADDVRLLARAVLARCDGDDGLVDGVISDPLACRFDPAELQCRGGSSTACLTPAKVEAVRRIYAGPVNSKGERLYDAAPLKGSELDWIGAFVPGDGGAPAAIRTSMNIAFRNLNTPRRPPDWDITQLNWDQDYKKVWLAEAYASGANPDLRPFKAAGGKLIAYQGLADPFVLPGNFADYYETVQRTMGGKAATEDFFRLFLAPGLGHCTGGPGADVVDYIAYLEAWVERGEAPQALIASRVADSPAARRLPLDPAQVKYSRPVFAYPMVTRYSGAGDPGSASSFVPAPSGGR